MDARATIADSQIVTDLNEKPTNLHQYLLATSNHPPHTVCKNLPYGLGLRLRVIVSKQETLELRLKELSALLYARGYSEGLIAWNTSILFWGKSGQAGLHITNLVTFWKQMQIVRMDLLKNSADPRCRKLYDAHIQRQNTWTKKFPPAVEHACAATVVEANPPASNQLQSRSVCSGGGLDQAVDLCGNWVTCPSHPLNCNLRCLSSSRSISLASTILGCIFRSLVMFSDGCKSTPSLVTMAEQKRHEVSFE